MGFDDCGFNEGRLVGVEVGRLVVGRTDGWPEGPTVG